MAIERMKLRVVFSSLHCNEEADGRGSAEPYLWAFYFKIDGFTATLDLNANNQLVLRGTSTNIGSQGSLGNLGTTDVDAFENVTVPPALRSHGEPLLLEPIPLSQAARALHPNLEAVGALAGFVVALMENDDVSSADAEAAHGEFDRSMRDTVKDAIDEFVVPSVIAQPTAEDIATLFQDNLGPKIVELVEARRDQGATFPNYSGDGRDDKVGVHAACFVHQAFVGGRTLQANANFDNRNHGRFSLSGLALGIEALPNHEITLERSVEVGGPKAEGSVSGAAIQATTHIVYRDRRRHVLSLFRDASGQASIVDLTELTGAWDAAGDPFAYVETPTSILSVLYRGREDNHVHGIFWGPGTSIFGHEDMTRLAGASPTVSDPVGYLDGSNMHHVIFRDSNGDLHEMWTAVGGGPVGHANLTRAARANRDSMYPPSARGNPSAYVNVHGTNIVIFRGDDGHIWSLHWDPGAAVFAENISGFTNSPTAGGDPCAVYMSALDLNQIVYRTLGGNSAGELIELFWQGVNAAVGWNITQAAAPSLPPGSSNGLSQADPVVFHNPATNTKHVIYQMNGFLKELSWPLGTLAARHKDLTIAGVAPTLMEFSTRPVAFLAGGTVHLPFRGRDGHVYEIVR